MLNLSKKPIIQELMKPLFEEVINSRTHISSEYWELLLSKDEKTE